MSLYRWVNISNEPTSYIEIPYPRSFISTEDCKLLNDRDAFDLDIEENRCIFLDAGKKKYVFALNDNPGRPFVIPGAEYIGAVYNATSVTEDYGCFGECRVIVKGISGIMFDEVLPIFGDVFSICYDEGQQRRFKYNSDLKIPNPCDCVCPLIVSNGFIKRKIYCFKLTLMHADGETPLSIENGGICEFTLIKHYRNP